MDELEELRKQLEEVTELYHLQSQRASDYAGAFMRSKREWVGLTNEERLALWSALECDLECLKPAQYAEAIEQALREKNS